MMSPINLLPYYQLFNHSPLSAAILDVDRFKLEMVNEKMLELGQDRHTKYLPALQHVYHNGVPYSFIENGLNFTFTPLFDGNSGITGVCLIASKFLN